MVPRLKPDIEDKPDFTISVYSKDADTGIDLELFTEYLSEIESYRPFGKGFEMPEAELEFYPRDLRWYFMGEGEHIRAYLPNDMQLVCFNQGRYFPNGFDKTKMPKVTKVRGTLGLNRYNNEDQIQFNAKLGPDMDQSKPMDR